jgi:hypothetical protein
VPGGKIIRLSTQSYMCIQRDANGTNDNKSTISGEGSQLLAAVIRYRHHRDKSLHLLNQAMRPCKVMVDATSNVPLLMLAARVG